MFFLLPIAHELSSVRKWPLFAMLVVALNALLLVATMAFGDPGEARVSSTQQAAQTFADAHPKAAKTAPAGCLKPHGIGDTTDESKVLEELGLAPPATTPPPEEADDAPETLAKLCAAVVEARDTTIPRRFGYVPEKGFGIGILTHQFLHAGIFHLLFNMWFFWLCGCNLEDRWGKGIFAVFYLAGGAAGALLYGKMAHDKGMPLIGASGAVAAAMGGFLAILGTTRIRFAYVVWISLKPKYGTFEAVAYWMLPLWLVSELAQAFIFPEDGTAHWAHVGGFAFGLVVGLAMRFSGLDAKLDHAAEEEGTVRQDPRILAAATLTDEGKLDQAIASLEALLRDSPDDVDALVELLRAVTATRDVPRRIAVCLRLMHSYLGQGFIDAAADVYQELRVHQLDREITCAATIRLGEAFARRQRSDIALLAFRNGRRDGLVDEESVRASVAEASVLVRMGRIMDARLLFDDCKASPFLSHDLEQHIERELTAIGGGLSTASPTE